MNAAREEELRRVDRAARSAAQSEFARPLVLEAGAGTGKTTVLVGRLAAWALERGWQLAAAREAAAPREAPAAHDAPSDPRIAARVLERIVAITFTEAAAAQMASRVAEAFASIERGELPEGMDPLPDTPRDELARRARALLGALDHLVVRTIHAFCRRLLAAHPFEAGVRPDFEVDAESALTAEAVREVVEAELARGYEESDGDLLALAHDGIGPAEIEQSLLALVGAGLPAAELERDPFEPERVEEAVRALQSALEAALDAAAGRLAEVSAELTGETIAALEDTRTLNRGGVRSADELARFCADLRSLWSGRNVQRLRRWRRGELTVGERRALGTSVDEFAAAVAPLVRWLEHFLALDPEAARRAARVLGPLLADAGTELRARGLASFQDLLVGARDLLVRHPELAREVRQRIDQLLVDEFQDTDRVQCELVEQIALVGPPEERPALFVVGDPKQSIYGWRSADLRAYERFVARVCELGGTVARLHVNFRSVPAVLDEVERAIEPVMRAEAGLQPEFEPLVTGPNRAGALGFSAGRAAPVEYWVSWTAEALAETRAADAAELEAAAVAREIRELHERHGLAWSEFGLLFRARGDFDVYLAALRDAGVPYAVQGDRNYYRRREIIEAAAAVRCILDPGDALALVTSLRAAWVGVPDTALLPLWARGFPDRVRALGAPDAEPDALERVCRVAREAAAALPDGIPGLERVAGWELSLVAFAASLEALRISFRQDPADVFVEKLRSRFLIEATEAARYQGAYRLANLELFFARLVEDLGLRELGTAAVLRGLRRSVAEAMQEEEGRPREATEDAVQIYTIHQAKGLDFGHVYALQLQKGSGASTNKKDPVIARVGGRWEFRLLGASSAGLAAARDEEDRVARAELVRTLYVAMTRARERLVLASSWSRRERDTHQALLRERTGSIPELSELFARLRTSGEAWSDECNARWFFPALASAVGAGELVAPGGAAVPDADQIRADSALLAARAERAAARMARPLGGPASAEAHRKLREKWEAPGRRPARAGSERVALAVGSAVHSALEALDLHAPESAARAQAGALAQAILATHLGAPELERGRELFDEVLERFFAGPLHARLRALAERVIARELDLLAPPLDGAGIPVAFQAGAIDLVYRDAGGRLVIADYKTDRVEGAAELAARAKLYAPQGTTYVRALRTALELDYDPRFELWFLHAGEVV